MRKTTIAWAPNAQKDDLFLALSLLFSPWRWFQKDAVKLLQENVSDYLGKRVYAFDSARSALFAILKSLQIEKGDEVLLQAFTCVALPNPILWAGAKPIYVDIDLENLNIDIDDLERKITPNSKAVVIQYTFGIAPDLERIKNLCEKYNLYLIEDNCHNFGQKFKVSGIEYKAGTFGDASIISFGQEKVVSATRGGFAYIRNDKAEERLKIIHQNLKSPRIRDILRGILNPIVWKFREASGLFGELVYRLFVAIKLQELGLTKEELKGKKADHLPYSMPNSNAILGNFQFKKLEQFIEYRKNNAENYYQQLKQGKGISFLSNNDFKRSIEGLKIVDPKIASKFASPMWLRFPGAVENAEKVRLYAESKGIILGNWYTNPIHCKGVDMSALNYKEGSCPKVEWLVKRSINLPTHVGIGNEEIKKIIDCILV